MSITSTTPLEAAPPGVAKVYFGGGIPGFPQAKAFSLRPWGTGPGPFCVLESEDVRGLCFVVVDPVVFFPSYEPELGPEVYRAVDAGGREDLQVLVILTLHSRPEDTTANLLGPVVVNTATGNAVQAVLSGSGFDPQARVVGNKP
jgi:flagellar assembly factor FliW